MKSASTKENIPAEYDNNSNKNIPGVKMEKTRESPPEFENRVMAQVYVMPPFHQGLFCPIDPIWTRLSPIHQFLIRPIVVLNRLLSCPPFWPDWVPTILTRQIEAVITFWPASNEHVPIFSAGLVFAL